MSFQTRDLTRPATRVVHKRRVMTMYSVCDYEMDTFAAGYSSPAIALFGVFFGAAFALWLTFATVTLAEPAATRIFVLAWLSTGLTILALIQAIRDWRGCKRLIKQITTEKVETIAYEVQQK
jgi:hypothetical protein